MHFLNKSQLLNLVENTLKDVRKNNEYTNLKFVDGIFSEAKIIDDVKNIIKGNPITTIEENFLNRKPVFTFEHLYNYLRCENQLSKYEAIAEKMLYPSIDVVLESEDKLVEEYAFENTETSIDDEKLAVVKKSLAVALDELLYKNNIHQKFIADYTKKYFYVNRTFEYYKSAMNLGEDMDERDLIGNEDYMDFQSFIQVNFSLVNDVVEMYFFRGYEKYNKFQRISEKYTDFNACADAIVKIAIESINEISKTSGTKISESYPEQDNSYKSKLLKEKSAVYERVKFIKIAFDKNNLFEINFNGAESTLKILKNNNLFCEIEFVYNESTDRFIYYVMTDDFDRSEENLCSDLGVLTRKIETIIKENQ